MINVSTDKRFVALMALVYGLAVLPLSFELPAINVIANSFHLSSAAMKFSISLFWAMFTIGQFACAYLLPRISVPCLTSSIISIFSISFLLNLLTHQDYVFFTLRIFEGFCCGSLLLLGRFAMANQYGHNETKYLLQFARLSSMITALTVVIPMLGGIMSEYFHWYLIYISIAVLGLSLWPLKKIIFTFDQPEISNVKSDFLIVFNDVPLLGKSVLGGFSRSIIVNFNMNLALFLLNYCHWSNLHYATLMFFYSLVAIFSRLYLSHLRAFFGADRLHYVLMCLLLLGSLCFLDERFYAYNALYFVAGAIVTMSSSLLSTLYSSFAQFRLAKQNQAMSLAVMGVVQNTALVLGTLCSVFLANDSMFYLVAFIIFSTFVLFCIDYFVCHYDRTYKLVA